MQASKKRRGSSKCCILKQQDEWLPGSDSRPQDGLPHHRGPGSLKRARLSSLVRHMKKRVFGAGETETHGQKYVPGAEIGEKYFSSVGEVL